MRIRSRLAKICWSVVSIQVILACSNSKWKPADGLGWLSMPQPQPLDQYVPSGQVR